MDKHIICSRCGKRIFLGDNVYSFLPFRDLGYPLEHECSECANRYGYDSLDCYEEVTGDKYEKLPWSDKT